MKKALIALAVASLAMSQAHAKTVDYEELNQELNIMSEILQTALRQNNNRKGLRFARSKAYYLANQGVVFQMQVAGVGGILQADIDFGGLFAGLKNLPEPPEPPRPIVDIESHEHSWEISIDEDWQDYADDMVDHIRDAFSESRDQLRDLRERARDFAWERRELERRKRDLEFEKRAADENTRKELEQESRELEKEMAKLQKKQDEITNYAEEIEQEQRQLREKRKQTRTQHYTRFMASFEEVMADTLCKYGAGLQALPKSENISFVLPHLGSSDAQGRQDKVYVFTHQDVRSCVTGKFKSDELLAKATTYLF